MKKIVRLCFLSLVVLSCSTGQVKSDYRKKVKQLKASYEKNLATIKVAESDLVDLGVLSTYRAYLDKKSACGSKKECTDDATSTFIMALEKVYPKSSIDFVLKACDGHCTSAKQLEYLVAKSHNTNIQTSMTHQLNAQKNEYDQEMNEVNQWYKVAYARAQLKDHQDAAAFAAGMQAFADGVNAVRQQQQQYYSPPPTQYVAPPQVVRLGGGSNIQVIGGGTTTTTYSFSPRTFGYSSNNFGQNGTTYYSGTVSGTSQRTGTFTYHNFNNGLSGTTQNIGQFQYHNFNNGLSGSTQNIGQFQYHNFNNGLSGTTQNVENSSYSHFSDGTNCSSQKIGNYTYTNCR